MRLPLYQLSSFSTATGKVLAGAANVYIVTAATGMTVGIGERLYTWTKRKINERRSRTETSSEVKQNGAETATA